jgi:exosome complex component RRP42
MPNAEGSAEVTLGNTTVIAGVKVDVGTPLKDKPEEGSIITSAELSPMASDKYEPGPPTPEAIEISRVIDRGIRAANVVDTKSLYINEEKVWNAYIDIYAVNYDGNIFDAGTLAAIAALSTSKMPRFEDEKVVRENMGKLKINAISTSCTFAKVAGHILLDPDGNEEAFSNVRLTIANDEKYIRAMQKGLGGSFTPKELDQMIDMTFNKSAELRSSIKHAIGD